MHYRDDPDQQNLIDWIQEGWVSLNIYEIYLTQKLFGNLIRAEINKIIYFAVGMLWNRGTTRQKTYTSIAHPRLLDQGKPVAYHFLAVSVLR